MKTYSIVGMNFLKTEEVVAALQTGAALTLRREPTNRFDPNAVQVCLDGKPIGYIPKSKNKELAARLDAGGMAMDGKLVRSPASNYPQVQIGGADEA